MSINTLKWVLVGVTLITFVTTFAHILPGGGVSVNSRSNKLLQCQRGMMILYVCFLPVVSQYAFSLESFRIEVMKWQANESHYSSHESPRPEFNHDRWNRFGFSVFATTLVLLFSLYIAYSCLIGALRPAMEESAQKSQGGDEHVLYTITSPGSNETREKPIVKRVTFDLPDIPENRIVQLYSYLSKQLLRHMRRIVSFVSYAFLVVYLLPASLEHAFYLEIASFKGVTLTSDHVVVMFAIYLCVELVFHNFVMTRPTDYSEIRFMFSRFTLCYGAFLIILTVLALLQFNDTLKLYLYRMYEPHATFKVRPTSFYDSSIPNINIVSMVLENYMTKYSYSLISSETSRQERNVIIKSSLAIFSSVFSDCIACIMFATMVCVPAVLCVLV